MVTDRDEVAAALLEKQNDANVIMDINSCCEYLNTRNMVKRNIHGVVGYGMGGSYALLFACHRKRLRAAVSYYGKMVQPRELMRDLSSRVLYHQAGLDAWTTNEEVQQLRAAAAEYGKQAEICTYPDAPHAFCNELNPGAYRAASAALAWERTASFLKTCFQGT
jgi:carboxymethylenebutenolidase